MIALVHYHLRLGGVRRIMESQARLLSAAGRDFKLVVGEAPKDPDFPWPYELVEGLAYEADCPALASTCPDVDLWHFHNPTLGKNASLTPRIAELAASGARVLMHIHDFAEDARPSNYARIPDPKQLYPISHRVQYATINSRDSQLLVQAGLPAHQVHNIGNPVLAPEGVQRKAPQGGLWFYPVRGIRRKNLGEAVLLAAQAKYSKLPLRIAVALPADTPAQARFHDAWVDFARQWDLPIDFAVVDRQVPAGGQDASFAAWLDACSQVLTTSIAEGFGMAFLEPGLLGIPLIGRDLPEITRDFSEQPCGALYRAIHIDGKDFGTCAEAEQEGMIRALLGGRIRASADGQALANWIQEALKHHEARPEKSEIEARFGGPSYLRRLLQCYADLESAPAPSGLSWGDSSRLLDFFASPERFNPLRSL